jgi:hypothetical protein
MLVQTPRVYAIKQVVRVIFVVLEDLEYLLVYGDLVVSVWVDYVLLLRKSKML